MKPVLSLLTLLLALSLRAQQSPNDRLRLIVAEAKRLYRSEKTSRIASGLLLAKLDSSKYSGDYFSYPDGDRDHFIAFTPGADPRVIGEVIVDLKAAEGTAQVLVAERALTPEELAYQQLRAATATALLDTKFFLREKAAQLILFR